MESKSLPNPGLASHCANFLAACPVEWQLVGGQKTIALQAVIKSFLNVYQVHICLMMKMAKNDLPIAGQAQLQHLKFAPCSWTALGCEAPKLAVSPCGRRGWKRVGKCKMLRSGLGRKPADKAQFTRHESRPTMWFLAKRGLASTCFSTSSSGKSSIFLEWSDGSMGHSGTMVVLQGIPPPIAIGFPLVVSSGQSTPPPKHFAELERPRLLHQLPGFQWSCQGDKLPTSNAKRDTTRNQ